MIKLKWLFVLSLMTVSLTQAQQPQKTPIIPPSPNAASLGVYGEIPVSLYTGVPEISIPLYTIKTNSLTLPVSLSYHASGIKVAQEATWVGLGWVLNCGGVITRTVRGIDDFKTGGPQGFIQNSNLPPSDPGNNPISISSYQSAYSDLYTRNLDPEPDLFYYNFNNFSGKMVYNPAMQGFSPLNAANLKIQYSNITESWTVYTAEGVKYVFGSKEISTNYSAATGANEYDVVSTNTIHNPYNLEPGQPYTVSAWYLDSIISPAKDYIVFIYDNSHRHVASEVSKGQVVYRMASFEMNYDLNSDNTWTPQLQGIYDYNYASQTVTDEIYLKTIQSSEGLRLDFSTSGRDDMETLTPPDNLTTNPLVKAQKLNTISISNDLSSLPARKYNFYYGYFESAQDPYSDFKNKRLRLDSFSYSSGSIGTPPYIFSYIPGTGQVFSQKDSKQVDHWGYYNRAVNNDYVKSDWGSHNHASLIPAYPIDALTSVSGANREPNEEMAVTWTLQNIKYPTGGSTQFDYQLNDYPVYAPNAPVTQTRITQATASQIVGDTISRTNQVVPFTITNSKLITVSYNAYSPTQAKTCGPFGSQTDNTIKYTEMDGFMYAVIENSNHIPIEQFKYNEWKITCSYPVQEETKTIILPAGNYYLNTFVLNDGTLNKFRTMIKATWLDTTGTLPPHYNTVKGGGLRIKRIASTDGQNNITKSYKYTGLQGGLNASSGSLLAPVNYFMPMAVLFTNFISPGAGLLYTSSYHGNFICGQSSTITPLGTAANGNSIGYSQVTELVDSNGTLGKTVYYYANFPEQVTSSVTVPNVPNDLPYNNGQLNRVEYYSASNTLLKSIRNFYIRDAGISPTVKGLKMYSLPFASNPFPVQYRLPDIVKFYDNKMEWWRKIADTTVIYSPDGLKSLTTVNTYEYDPVNLEVNKITTTGSNGKTIVNTVFYAHNYPSETSTSTATMDAMKSINMIGLPLKREKYVNASRMDGTINDYGSNLLPSGVQVLEGNTFKPKTLFDSYGTNGVLTQYHNASDYSTAVLWAYNNSNPFVIGEGISYANLQAGVAQVLADMGYPIGPSQTDDFLASLGTMATLGQKGSFQAFLTNLKSNALLTNEFLTIYTCDPLSGVVSSTDIGGRSTYYEYDNLGRLLVLRDRDNNILKAYEYKYYPVFTPDWKNTTTAIRCVTNSYNENTGYQEQEQKDMNFMSITANQTRWVTTNYNTTACPLPPCDGNCTGNSKKCINNVCVRGVYQVLFKFYASPVCVTQWGYMFPDGTFVMDHSDVVYGPCN